ncbi:MAG: hypothetical protein ACK4UP_00195 [Spirosomataceae bacterium]
MKFKKVWVILSIAFISSVTFSCSPEATNENLPKSKNILSLIFIDKSVSIDFDNSYVQSKYKEAVTTILQEGVLKAGDQLEGYYIHENTLKGRCLTLNCMTEMEDISNMNTTDKEMSELDYQLQIGKEKNQFTKKILKIFGTKNNQESNKFTDITSSLQIINAHNTGEKVISVYFFSDMIESTSNGRDFHVNPPSSMDEATKWAEEDVEKMQDINLNGVTIKSILPFDPLSSTKINNPTVSTYWKVVFESLGASSFEEI